MSSMSKYKQCKECTQTFYKKANCSLKEWEKTTFCSVECFDTFRRGKPSCSPSTTFKKGHIASTKAIEANKARCGSKNHLWKGGQITLVCQICENDFQVDPYRSKIAKTCSQVCYNELRKTPEFRLTLSDIQRKLVEEKLGEIRSYITSLDKVIRNSVMYKIWRECVFKRDNYTCQDCRVRSGILRADHIKQFATILIENDVKTFEDALNCVTLWDIRNGKTLCDACHYKTPTYGRQVTKI